MTETTMFRIVSVGMAILCALGAVAGFYGAGKLAREDWPDLSGAIGMTLLSGIMCILAIASLGIGGFYQ